MDVPEFLRENYTEYEIWQTLAVGRKTRLETVFEAIEKAKNNAG